MSAKFIPFPRELRPQLSDMQRRAERIVRQRHARALAIAQSVGIPDTGCCLHNAYVSLGSGKGWDAPRPDYPAYRRAIRQARHILNLPSPHRIVDDWYTRKCMA